ncbi:hypothetical protein niasHT_018648 [Heterodera trifolii]|uniref:DDE-1 domain-containing protein n=1 Tax=Heterodera trifolii TaxID=157864 RepID=A0ABD2KZ40_9BILA
MILDFINLINLGVLNLHFGLRQDVVDSCRQQTLQLGPKHNPRLEEARGGTEKIYFALVTLLFMPAMKRPCVTVLNTGHEKARVTVILTARSDGKKLQPFVLLHKKRPIPNIINCFKSRLHLCWCGRVWMDNELTTEYLESAIPNGLALLKQRRKEDAVIKGVEEIDLGEDESDTSVDI